VVAGEAKRADAAPAQARGQRVRAAYPRRAAAASTRSRVAAESWSGRVNALDTVFADTPTSAATRCRVMRSGRTGATR
jgi:hypothetical protein